MNEDDPLEGLKAWTRVICGWLALNSEKAVPT